MLVTPRPGVSGNAVLEGLTALENTLVQVQNNLPRRDDFVVPEYLRWAAQTEEVLRRLVGHDDVDWLVPGRNRDRLSSAPLSAQRPLCHAEIRHRRESFIQAIDALRTEVARWAGAEGDLLVLDTNVFLHAPVKFAEVDLIGLINQSGMASPYPPGWALHLVVPMVVLDELDNLKLHNNSTTRWRARHALHVLDKAFGTAMKGRLPQRIMVEAIVDPPGHVRLPIPDDEIVDRATAIGNISGKTVSLLTFDTGMATRARTAGLRTWKVPQPPQGDEPEPAGAKTPRS